MIRTLLHSYRLLIAGALLLAPCAIARADDKDWIDLTAHGLEAWKEPTGAWLVAGDAGLDPENKRRLASKPGKGVIVNGPKGTTNDIVTKQKFADIEAHFEFMVPERSNSGVKFE